MRKKTCTKCLVDKPIDQFYISKARRGRKASTTSFCIDCNKKYFKSDKFRDCQLKSRYGITLDIYNNMLDAQHGVCAICGKPETRKTFAGKIQKLQIDHDHKTGVIRGLLCNSCNSGIGYFRDSPEIMKKAMLYLENQNSCPPVSRKNLA